LAKAVKGKKGDLENRSEYLIAFVGLKDGLHEFDYHIDQTFFDSFENALIESCDVKATLLLNKKSTMLEMTFVHEGKIFVNCDRCGEEVDIEIKSENPLIFKFSHQSNSDSDEVVFVGMDETEVDVAPFFYEFITLSLPSRMMHEEGKCNEDILALIEDLNSNDSEEIDPRWDALKKLKKKE